MSVDSLYEIEFWSNNVSLSTAKFIEAFQFASSEVSSGFSDAADSACGAQVESEPELIFHQNWSESVRRSTWSCLLYTSPSPRD